MERIKQFSQILLIVIFLSACKSSSNEEYPIINSGENINENTNSKKERMEIKFSCGKDGIAEYIKNGWVILKEDYDNNFQKQSKLQYSILLDFQLR